MPKILKIKKLEQLLQNRKNRFDEKPVIEAPVGVGQQNDPKDVRAIKTILEDILPEIKKGSDKTSTVTPDFSFDIQQFQESNDLKVDGLINPGGETETELELLQKRKLADLAQLAHRSNPAGSIENMDCAELRRNYKRERIELLTNKAIRYIREAQAECEEKKSDNTLTKEDVECLVGAINALGQDSLIDESGKLPALSYLRSFIKFFKKVNRQNKALNWIVRSINPDPEGRLYRDLDEAYVEKDKVYEVMKQKGCI